MIGCAFFLSSFSSFCFRVNARENQLTSQKLSCYTHTRTLTRDIFTFITQVTITEGVGTLLFDVVEKFRSFLFLFFFPVFPGVSVMRYFSFRSLSLSLCFCFFVFFVFLLFLALKLFSTHRNVNYSFIHSFTEFDTVAREWRMKWSPDDDKASLAAAQKVLEKQLATVKAVKGVKSVQRVVCGGCMDFKVIVALDGDSFGEWEAAGFAPEADFLKEVESIKGIQQVETQTFTLMPM
jgi:hypothetical protein